MQSFVKDDDLVYVHLSHSKPQARLLSIHARAHLQVTRRLYELAEARHMPAVARMSDCCRTPALYKSEDTGQYILAQKTCKHRLCPRCGLARSRRLCADATVITSAMDAPKFVTLTIVSSKDPLEERLKHLRDSFARLRRSKLWKRHFKKGISVVEITHNPKTDLFHPHLHLIVDGTYTEQAKLAEAWHVATGDSRIVHIRAIPVKTDAIRYIAKYAAKTGDFNAVPDHRVNEWLDAVASLRTHALFGPGARKAVKREKPAKDKSVRAVTPLGILHDMSDDGNELARNALTLIYAIGRGRVQNPSAEQAAKLEARNLQIALLLRSLGIEGESHPCSIDPAASPHPPPEHHADRRPVGLWEEPNDAAAAIRH